MTRFRSGPRTVLAMAGVVAILAAACGGSAATPAPATEAPAATQAPAAATQAPAPTPQIVMVTPEPIATATGPNGGKVLRWFIGLGGGGKPEQIAAEQKFAADFNAAQSDIYLTPEIYDNSVAAQQLQVQIAAGNPPDIIGPVGVEGLNIFRDNLLDLKPLIQSEGFDMSKFDPGLVDFFDIGKDGATIGVPYAMYPSFIYYNTKLFDEAKLPYPPTKVGEMYEGKPWDMAALRDLSMKLTVDENGNDATSPDFDAEKIVQWGFDMQWADDRSDTEATIFGSSSVVTPDGKTAQITPQFTEGMKWFNEGVWTDHFIPTSAAIQSDLLAKGNPFQSGNLAMASTHLWYTCCINPAPPAKPSFSWGTAINPESNGVTTAKLHADTFSILNTTQNPELAFKVVSELIKSPELLTNYGGLSADPALQQAFLDSVQKNYPDSVLDTGVVKDSLGLADKPSHQGWLPDYQKSRSALKALYNKYRTTPGLDMEAELAALQTTLQGIFDEYNAANP